MTEVSSESPRKISYSVGESPDFRNEEHHNGHHISFETQPLHLLIEGECPGVGPKFRQRLADHVRFILILSTPDGGSW